MKTIVINIFGAPGSGKSTLAAELFVWMKQKGYSVELVRECIKKWAWEGHKPNMFEQIYITNQQMLEETALYGKVKYLITDSPLELGNFYCEYYHKSDALAKLDIQVKLEGKIKGLVDKFITLYVPIDETIYKEEGRYSNLEEAKLLDKKQFQFITDKFNTVRVLNGAVCNRLINSIEYIEMREKS